MSTINTENYEKVRTIMKGLYGDSHTSIRELNLLNYENTDELDSLKIQEVFIRCMYEDNPNDEDYVCPYISVTGRVFGFDPNKIEQYMEQIKIWLNQLDPTFKEGWSLLNAPFDKDGRQWGEQIDADRLFALGTAAGLVENMKLPRFLCPGGLPYFMIFDEDACKGIQKIQTKNLQEWFDANKTSI